MESVTICIPAYNSALTIRDTLDSILNQSYSNLEIIVSDNHSTDRTVSIVTEEYARYGVKIVTCPLLPVKDGKLLDNCYSAIQNWNSLVNLGQSKYVGIFHADDHYSEELVETQMTCFREHRETSAVFSMLRYIGADGEALTKNWSSFAKEKILHFNQVGFIDVIADHSHFFSSSGVILNRELWKKAGEFDAVKWGHQVDTEFWIRISGQGPIAIVNKPFVYHRNHTSQETSKWKEIYRYEYLPFFKILDYYLDEKQFKHRIKARSVEKFECFRMKDAMRVSRNFLSDGNTGKALNSLKEIRRLPINQLFNYFNLSGKKFVAKVLIFKMIYYCLRYRNKTLLNLLTRAHDKLEIN